MADQQELSLTSERQRRWEKKIEDERVVIDRVKRDIASSVKRIAKSQELLKGIDLKRAPVLMPGRKGNEEAQAEIERLRAERSRVEADIKDDEEIIRHLSGYLPGFTENLARMERERDRAALIAELAQRAGAGLEEKIVSALATLSSLCAQASDADVRLSQAIQGFDPSLRPEIGQINSLRHRRAKLILQGLCESLPDDLVDLSRIHTWSEDAAAAIRAERGLPPLIEVGIGESTKAAIEAVVDSLDRLLLAA